MSEEKKDIKVEYSFLSKTCGLKVSNLCLGAMTFGNNEVSQHPRQLLIKLILIEIILLLFIAVHIIWFQDING